MNFNEWLDEVLGKDFKHLPNYDEQLHTIGCGNLKKAWDAARDEAIKIVDGSKESNLKYLHIELDHIIEKIGKI